MSEAIERLLMLEQAVEQDHRRLLEGSSARLQEFERRIAGEWSTLRKLHEDAIAGVRAMKPTPAPPAPRSRRWWTWGLGAALAIVAADAGYLHWQLRAERSGYEARLAALEASRAATDAPDAAAAREAAAQHAGETAVQAAAQAALMVDVVTAPDARRVDLAGQTQAAAASGQIIWSRSRGLLLSATGMPPLSSTDAYQVWVTTTRGPVSLGFVAPDLRGRVSAAFDVPAELPGAITGGLVTREATGGAPQPGGTPILAAR